MVMPDPLSIPPENHVILPLPPSQKKTKQNKTKQNKNKSREKFFDHPPGDKHWMVSKHSMNT